MISSLWCVGSSGFNFGSGISARNSQNLQMKYAKMRRLLPSEARWVRFMHSQTGWTTVPPVYRSS